MEEILQSSLRDEDGFGPGPWAEAYGYHRLLAPRGGGCSHQKQAKTCQHASALQFSLTVSATIAETG